MSRPVGRWLAASLAVASLLAACQATGTGAPGPRRASPHVVAKSPATTTAEPSTAPTATTPPSGRLLKPSGAVLAVTGTVQLDAAYALAHGATLVSNNGAQVLSFGDAALISDQGANLIASNGDAIISDNGAGILSNNGGGIISDHGAGLVSDHGGGLVAQAAWRLLEAETPEFGTTLPVAGLAVGVVDLTTGQMAPLGQDAAGRRAHVIVTDATGGFQAFLPGGGTGALRVVGLPQTGADQRLRTARLTPRVTGSLALDEDSAQVAADLRQILIADYYKSGTVDPQTIEVGIGAFEPVLAPEVASDIKRGLRRVYDAYMAAGVPAMSEARQLAIAERLADVELASVPLDSYVSLDNASMDKLGLASDAVEDVPNEKAIVAVERAVKGVRLRIGRLMAAQTRAGTDPAAFFASRPYIQEAVERDGVPYTIRKPSDFSDFLVRGLLANRQVGYAEAALSFGLVYADKDLGFTVDEGALFMRAQTGLHLGLLKSMYSGDAPTLPLILDTLKALTAEPG